MKKRILKISAFCVALVLIGFICWFADSLVGNPISKLLANNAAKKHIALNYENTDYQITRVSYSFKDQLYYAHIKSPSSIDGDFTLYITKSGKIRHDDYGSRVLHHSNTANRLFFEYKTTVESVFESSLFPYKVEMAYGDLEFQRELDGIQNPDALGLSDLVNDRIYNVKELGATNGKLVLYVNDDDISFEKAAEILLCAKEFAVKTDISFYTVSFCLRHEPYDTETYKRPEGSIYIRNMLFSEIYEEDLAARLAQYATDESTGKETSSVTDVNHELKTPLTLILANLDIAEAELDHLFDRFYRADSSRKYIGGFGIGLSIAKAIVDKHKGEISAHKKGEASIYFKVVL